ncbi:hypothetical protein M758_10G186900 [Ceratodon purpureus]|uniref:Btz domain-containing protein n=1 Tax=Ceratodon purpureus TaxID=3225 RepID=A0A8T0GPS1_CERPU|nr:hypothetical protein KC19_10G191500 [Ceratodon purpureus]KAG0604664.1 hypothetical protein M758_10G186900 [Ceratodon purpureus]
MATALSESGLEEGEYESDSDGASALALRRREASDDEEREMPLHAVSSADDDEEDDEDDDEDASQHSFSDEDAEGQATPPDGEEDGAALLRRRRLVSDEEDDHEGLHLEDVSRKSADKEDGSQGTAAADATNGKEAGEEERKEAEPFVVPTAGAFYMHDDRFRGVAGARPRRGVGGSRKLWEAKDEKPWVHDLFEELNVRDDSYRDEGLSRSGRGRSRGRGRVNRDRNRGWVGKLASDSEELNLNRARRGRGRGRPARSEGGDNTRVEESGPSTTKGTQIDSTGSSNIEGQDESKKHESTVPPRRVVAGSLNSASPPFFPSSALQQKLVEPGSESNQSNVNQSTKGKERATRSGSQVFVAKSGGSGRGLQFGGALQSSSQSQQPVKPSTAQTTAQNARSSSSQGQPPVPPSAQLQSQQAHDQESHAPGAITQGSSGPIPANLGQPVQPARPKISGGRGGRGGNIQVVGGRGGSFVYHGGPATGMNNGVQKVEPGFAPPIPAVGPVQYGGHPPAGIPLPAVGMAMPNYSGQPQYGFPNSEVTWIPVLAGGGAIGAGYATPYMTMEGTPSPMYFSQPAAQPPTFRPAGNSSKPSGLWKPPPNQELGPDEFGHRQSKPRRYSEMNFGQ